ncbi:MAG: hypothetical protein ABW321_12900 [Polyangiales bacterium]
MSERDYGPWSPWSVDQLVARFKDAPFRWWVSGGHALALWLGHSWRSHGDLDLGLLRGDVALAAGRLPDCTLHVAAAGELSPFVGQPLTAAAHQNNVWARERASNHWVIDLTLGAGDDTRWIYRRDPAIHRPWAEAVLTSATGIPYLAPDLQLLFKSLAPRPKDTRDAEIVIPALTRAQQEFLAHALPCDHAWQALLRAHSQ